MYISYIPNKSSFKWISLCKAVGLYKIQLFYFMNELYAYYSRLLKKHVIWKGMNDFAQSYIIAAVIKIYCMQRANNYKIKILTNSR